MAQPTSPAALALWAQESPLLPAEVPDAATAAAMRALGLPLSLGGEEPPAPPFAAPFSGVVPFLLRLFRGCCREPIGLQSVPSLPLTLKITS